MKKDINQINRKLSKLAFILIIPLLIFTVSCNDDDDDDIGGNENKTILQVAQSKGELSTFVAAVAQYNDLSASLDNENETYTVFAPTDDAFDVFFQAMGYGSLDDIPDDTLKGILQYHILPDLEARAADLTDGYSSETQFEEAITITLNGSTIRVNTAVVTEADVAASNGVIHVIDAVLLPVAYGGSVGGGGDATIASILNSTSQLSTLNDAIASLDELASSLGNEGETMTLFAPTNDAFDALLRALNYSSLEEMPADMLNDILQYHLLSASEVMAGDFTDGQTLNTALDEEVTIQTNGNSIIVNASTVITADVQATNGVVHIIDAVLVPEEYRGNFRTLLDVAKNNEDLSLFVETLANYPELMALVSSVTGDYTVFAPTNKGFETLLLITGQQEVSDIPVEMMERFLRYHIATEALTYEEITGRETLPTVLPNETLEVRLDSTGTFHVVDKSEVLVKDSLASNGMLQVIRGFLFPSVEAGAVNTIIEPFYFNTHYSTLNEAISRADLFSVLTDKSAGYTFFAPSNDGFEQAGITSLDAYTTEDLQEILYYHLHTDSAYTENSLAQIGTLSTPSGSLTFTSEGGSTLINSASEISKADLTYQNGITHIIGKALIPE